MKRRGHWQDDTEAQFANILGRSGTSSGGGPSSTSGTPPVPIATSLLLRLIDFETLNVARSLHPVAVMSLTTHAALKAARELKVHRRSLTGQSGYRLGRGRGDTYATDHDSTGEPQEVTLAFHSVPYDVGSTRDGSSGGAGQQAQTGGAVGLDGGGGSHRSKEDAIMAVTNHGRVLVWDTGHAEVCHEPN